MTLLQSIALGFVQGLTEFFPVSSSGHLLLAESWMQLPLERLQDFDVLLHAGTLSALILCYHREWWRMVTWPLRQDHDARHLLRLLIVATVPGVIAGYLLADFIESNLRSVRSVGFEFILNGIILVVAERFAQWRFKQHLKLHDAFFIGCAQALALSPGLSRSALTIAAGRMAHLERRDALDFSFLMATPIIAGATAFALGDIVRASVMLPPMPVLLAGIISALCASVIAILFLRRFVAKNSLALFAWYLIPVGLLLCIGT